MRKLLFICTGNTCRSSLAEVIARRILEERGKEKEVLVSSAGLAAIPGMPASPQAIEVAEQEGLDLKGHQARNATPEGLKEADLILTMTEQHKQMICELVPRIDDKVYTLKEYAADTREEIENNPDIADPFGESVEVYQECYEELKRYVTRAMDKFLEKEPGADSA
ncbi:low molecular weight protein arginine phosphatase [Calderihabitans maritimus]|uniref:Protein tyrosine phosphatase n=1 Tax=Calderihabitans maritimus TaxID=1246530 RepID=A0A1Z5HWA8_9FIRM|nr:low molecular weight protein arginine phosphatase [Calderihabitans maritimus]GAW93822.1 protein tyrosine phosphatase [Calderihabitans maritimus]